MGKSIVWACSGALQGTYLRVASSGAGMDPTTQVQTKRFSSKNHTVAPQNSWWTRECLVLWKTFAGPSNDACGPQDGSWCRHIWHI